MNEVIIMKTTLQINLNELKVFKKHDKDLFLQVPKHTYTHTLVYCLSDNMTQIKSINVLSLVIS